MFEQEARTDGYIAVENKITTRQEFILDMLKSHTGGLTVDEMIQICLSRGIKCTRNYFAPRLTELKHLGKVETNGRRKGLSGVKISVWELAK